MRILPLLIIVLISFNHIVYAEEIIYCPSLAQCDKEEFSSCKAKSSKSDIDPHPEYWKNDGGGSGGESIIKGEYKFTYAQVLNPTTRLPRVECVYGKQSNYGTQYISLGMSDELAGTYFDSFLKKSNNKWDVDITRHLAQCNSDYPSFCPIMNIPDLIYSFNESEKRTIGKHTILRIKNAPYNEVGDSFGFLTSMKYETLLEFCGTSPRCELEVETYSMPQDRFFIAGNVVLDLTIPNKIKVVGFLLAKNSACNLQKRKEPFNTIYCKE